MVFGGFFVFLFLVSHVYIPGSWRLTYTPDFWFLVCIFQILICMFRIFLVPHLQTPGSWFLIWILQIFGFPCTYSRFLVPCVHTPGSHALCPYSRFLVPHLHTPDELVPLQLRLFSSDGLLVGVLVFVECWSCVCRPDNTLTLLFLKTAHCVFEIRSLLGLDLTKLATA